MIRVTDDLVIDEQHLDERFVRASGPGGQNVNKVASAVELRFDLNGSDLPSDVKARLARLAGSRLTHEGVLLIDSREHRTQARNRDAAIRRLIALVRQAAVRPKRRRPTKPKPSDRERRLAAKKRRGAAKASRSRPRRDDD